MSDPVIDIIAEIAAERDILLWRVLELEDALRDEQANRLAAERRCRIRVVPGSTTELGKAQGGQ